jgi:D-arabinose 1-dehydrogenase-like Zn-dependent alcohol dehydrogenase
VRELLYRRKFGHYTRSTTGVTHKLRRRLNTKMSHSAAWLVAPKTSPFEIEPTPEYKPEASEIMVRNHAVAINPIDSVIRQHAYLSMDYPTILGCDVAGEVLSVGPNVTSSSPATACWVTLAA